MSNLIPQEIIESKILLLRGKKVMLDRDLAELYGVLTKVLNQAVKRNIRRFPDDFMFQFSKEELENWRSQIVTSKEKMGVRRRPYVFTEQGVAMLSSVLNSERAIQVNIQIIRTFTKLREMINLHREIEGIKSVLKRHDQQLRELLTPPEKPKRQIGFHPRTSH